MQSLLSLIVVLFVGFTLTSAGFREDALLLHNQYRAKHGAAPLVLNEAVNNYAQNWAEQMAKANTLEHSQGGNYGENIYYYGSTQISDSDAVKRATKSWYDEVSLYDYSNPGFSMDAGHFTQVVWKNSKNLGIGVARSKNRTYVCASYDPPGNYANRFPENVKANV